MPSNTFKKMINVSILIAVVFYTSGAVGSIADGGQKQKSAREKRRSGLANLYLDRHDAGFNVVHLSEEDQPLYQFFTIWKGEVSIKRGKGERSRAYMAWHLWCAFTRLQKTSPAYASIIQKMLHDYHTFKGSVFEKEDIIFDFAETFLCMCSTIFHPKSSQS